MTFPMTAQEAKVDSDRFINSSGAAKRLGVTTRTITRWILQGLFPGAFKINPSADNSPYLIPVSAIEEFERKRQEGSIQLEED